MMNVEKMIASAESCLGWPYVSPGTNDKNGIDCSGLFVKIYRDQGYSIYHGSNTIYRQYCDSDKGLIRSESQLVPGMAVFKWNENTPEKFSDGLGDFQHIGLVVSVKPLKIIHASSAIGCVTTDTKIGKWKYYGRLKAVDYGKKSGGDSMTATVTASNGQPVNMRTRPDVGSNSIRKVPVGATVEVNMEGTEWTLISYSGDTGYMMTKFLNFGGNSGDSGDMVTVERSVLKEIVDKLNLIMYG